MQTIDAVLTRPTPQLRGITAQPPKPAKQQRISTLAQLDTSNPKIAQAVEYARKWQARRAGNPEASYILASKDKGVGKTHILKSILWSEYDMPERFNDHIKIPANDFFMANDITRLIQGQEFGQTVADVIPKSRSFVCIDDIGTEQPFKFVGKEQQAHTRHSVWFSIVNHCYEHRIGIIATTNLQIGPELEEWVGSRAFDRLMEMAPKGFMRDLTGVPSWRKATSGR